MQVQLLVDEELLLEEPANIVARSAGTTAEAAEYVLLNLLELIQVKNSRCRDTNADALGD